MLFQWGNFKSASGITLDWKIECDALSDADWACIAAVGAKRLLPFGEVFGVPTGGAALARAFAPYCRLECVGRRALIVDDVWTTGTSMTKFVGDRRGWIGFVAFARGVTPRHVKYFAKILPTAK